MSKFEYGQEIQGTVLTISNSLAGTDEPLRFATIRRHDGEDVEAYISEGVGLSPGQSFRAKAGHPIYRPGSLAGRETRACELLDIEIDAKELSEPARRPAIISRLLARLMS
jgi:hypothetical protein